MHTCRALIGLPVLAPHEERRLGRISEVLLDHEHGCTIGMLVDGGSWFRPPGWLRTGDPAGDPALAEDRIVAPAGAIHPLRAGDRPQLERLRRRHEELLTSPVVTARGRCVGYLDDVLITADGWLILGYQLGTGWLDDWLGGKRIIPYSAALRRDGGRLILAEPPVGSEG